MNVSFLDIVSECNELKHQLKLVFLCECQSQKLPTYFFLFGAYRLIYLNRYILSYLQVATFFMYKFMQMEFIECQDKRYF